MAAAAKYAQEDGGEERPMRVCAEAGRKCVRNIQQYQILSVDWIALVDSLKQLSRLVQLEGRMPANTKVGEMQGRNVDSDGTLWDQEGHENAIRILVEEAKVNLCLRMMGDYKIWQANPEQKHKDMDAARHMYEYNELQLEQKCRLFEESMGILLCKAFQHVETLQLMDIPLLINHVYQILNQALTTPATESPVPSKLQETLVCYYFSSLMKHAEKLNNGELLANARQKLLVSLMTKHLLTAVFDADTHREVMMAAAEGFSAMADNEDFSPSWESFFADWDGANFIVSANLKAEFAQLETKMLAPVLAEHPDKKKDLRPLMDFFNQLRRSPGGGHAARM